MVTVMNDQPQTFLSYTRADEAKVASLHDRLVAAGYRPWMDRLDVVGGEPWKSKITEAIQNSDFFLACLSRRSTTKRGYLQKEIRDALDTWREKLPDEIYLIPVRLEECEIPKNLTEFQWVDLFREDGWSQLLRALQAGWKRRTEIVLGEGLPPSPEGSMPSRRPLPEAKPQLPVVTFPEELAKFAQRVSPETWDVLDEASRRFLVTMGTKLEPITQIVPRTPVPLVLGFETLALGSLGENFGQICSRSSHVDPGLLRLLLTLAAMKTISTLRVNAAQDGNSGARHLLFTMNLDPEMLDCPHIEDLFDRYRHCWETNVLFEVNERTTSKYLRRLKELQVDFNLRYCADDFNDWPAEVKQALESRVEMTKLDYRAFQAAMEIRGDNPGEAIARILAHKVAGKPMVVEGVEDPNHLRFLDQHWPFGKYGHLLGQGYIITPGYPWENWTTDLRRFGLPGGHILADSTTATDAQAWASPLRRGAQGAEMERISPSWRKSGSVRSRSWRTSDRKEALHGR